MDSFSQLIINAVEKVKTAVVKIDTYSDTDLKHPLGSGSGFLFSSDGYIFTNSHVINDAKKIMVTTHDGSVSDAGIVGEDPDSDLAVKKQLFLVILRRYLAIHQPSKLDRW